MASSSRLNPGEKGKINVKIDIKGKVGSISKAVRVFTNDPKGHVVTLTLRAMIKPPIQNINPQKSLTPP